MSLRIKGLVALTNQIQDQLAAGVTAAQAGPLKARITGAIEDVEAICRRNGTSPEQLPAPSRNAWRRLRAIDLDALPILEAGERPAVTTVRVKNLTAIADRLAARLADLEPGMDLTPAQRDARRAASEVDRICAHRDATPAALPERSRRAYAWLRFLMNADRLRAHVAAIARGKAALDDAAARQEAAGGPVPQARVELTSTTAIWRWRRGGGARALSVNEGFLDADEETWRALVAAALGGKDPRTRDRVRRWTEGEAFRAVARALAEATRDDDAAARGAVHDLAEAFARVDARYFDGRFARPELRWGRQQTSRRFGLCDWTHERITLSRRLDAEDVPAFVVDYVLFHELLHLVHGMEDRGLTRAAHTPAFRADEARFERRDEAERCLSALARRAR